jgi:protein HIRA/HIR1
MMFQNAHMAFQDGERDVNVGEPSRGHKRKASLLGDDRDRQPKGRMMISAQVRAAVELREIRAPRVPVASSSSSSGERVLPIPSVQTVLRAKPRDGLDDTVYLEVHNAADAKGKNKVTYAQGGQDIWVDYVPGGVLAASVGRDFGVVACEDGDVVGYSTAGCQ